MQRKSKNDWKCTSLGFQSGEEVYRENKIIESVGGFIVNNKMYCDVSPEGRDIGARIVP
jgi:hypothetical protein